MKIVYYSGTGNTKAMAEYIKEGIESVGKEVELMEVESATANDLVNEEIIILGSPACGAEELEDSYMEPFIEELKDHVNGKKVALFGSYSWGDGEFMRLWQDRMAGYGAELIAQGLIVNEAPVGESVDECKEFGKLIGQQ